MNLSLHISSPICLSSLPGELLFTLQGPFLVNSGKSEEKSVLFSVPLALCSCFLR